MTIHKHAVAFIDTTPTVARITDAMPTRVCPVDRTMRWNGALRWDGECTICERASTVSAYRPALIATGAPYKSRAVANNYVGARQPAQPGRFR